MILLNTESIFSESYSTAKMKISKSQIEIDLHMRGICIEMPMQISVFKVQIFLLRH